MQASIQLEELSDSQFRNIGGGLIASGFDFPELLEDVEAEIRKRTGQEDILWWLTVFSQMQVGSTDIYNLFSQRLPVHQLSVEEVYTAIKSFSVVRGVSIQKLILKM